MDRWSTAWFPKRRLGAWVVGAVGTVLAIASIEYFYMETARGELVLAMVEITLLLAIAYALVYGGYWLNQADFRGGELWRIAGWCLTGLLGTGSIGTWVVVNQFWQDQAVRDPVIFGLATLSVGAAGGVLVGVNEVRARSRTAEATRQREDLYALNQLLRHHILNGTQVILGQAEQLDDHVDDDGRTHLSTVRTRAMRLANLVDGARDLTTTLSGESTVGTVDLSTVLREEVAAARRETPDATFELDVPDDLTARGDDALGAVFDHLLRNAVEYNDTPDPTVRITAEAGRSTVQVRVADDGPGIPVENRRHLFERGRHGETGLGLYLVDALVTRYGGDVRVEDNDPRGSVFVVELPRDW